MLAARSDLVPRGATVLVAVSGGADSTALLHLLHLIASSRQLHLVAGTFDHGLRPASRDEARTVAARTAAIGVDCRIGRSHRSLRPTQDALRKARYEWLFAQQREIGAARLALGHQADDQAETVLFRIMRGTDLPGLAGIPLRRDSIVRPLLGFRRRDILRFLELKGIAWIEDPSNRDLRWARNRVREVILPALSAATGDAVPNLLALAATAARAEGLLEQLASTVLGQVVIGPPAGGAQGLVLSRPKLLATDPELQARVLRRVARRLGAAPRLGGTRACVEFISEGRSGGRASLGGGVEVRREFDQVLVTRVGEPASDGELVVPEALPGAGSMTIGGRERRVRWQPVGGASRGTGRIAVAVPRGHYPLRFRAWRAGDRIRLVGGSRKLKKLFGDRRVPVSERSRIAVLVDADERVLWIPGIGVAAEEDGVQYEDSLLEFELHDE